MGDKETRRMEKLKQMSWRRGDVTKSKKVEKGSVRS